MMLRIAYNLREAIDSFIASYPTSELQQDHLTSEEWSTIKTIKDFLEKLSMATKAYESKQSTLDLVLPSMDYILAQFEVGKDANSDDVIFGPMFN